MEEVYIGNKSRIFDWVEQSKIEDKEKIQLLYFLDQKNYTDNLSQRGIIIEMSSTNLFLTTQYTGKVVQLNRFRSRKITEEYTDQEHALKKAMSLVNRRIYKQKKEKQYILYGYYFADTKLYKQWLELQKLQPCQVPFWNQFKNSKIDVDLAARLNVLEF